MSRYRRRNTAGATYFFTLVGYRRQGILCEARIGALRDAIVLVRGKRPFEIDAWVLLPDHLHGVNDAAGRRGLCNAMGNDQTACEHAMR